MLVSFQDFPVNLLYFKLFFQLRSFLNDLTPLMPLNTLPAVEGGFILMINEFLFNSYQPPASLFLNISDLFFILTRGSGSLISEARFAILRDIKLATKAFICLFLSYLEGRVADVDPSIVLWLPLIMSFKLTVAPTFFSPVSILSQDTIEDTGPMEFQSPIFLTLMLLHTSPRSTSTHSLTVLRSAAEGILRVDLQVLPKSWTTRSLEFTVILMVSPVLRSAVISRGISFAFIKIDGTWMQSSALLAADNSCTFDCTFGCLKDGRSAFLWSLVLVWDVDLGCFIATQNIIQQRNMVAPPRPLSLLILLCILFVTLLSVCALEPREKLWKCNPKNILEQKLYFPQIAQI